MSFLIQAIVMITLSFLPFFFFFGRRVRTEYNLINDAAKSQQVKIKKSIL